MDRQKVLKRALEISDALENEGFTLTEQHACFGAALAWVEHNMSDDDRQKHQRAHAAAAKIAEDHFGS